jgi:catechol 2,3-dioxygenase-like lactoylglutathione lyase family enzyme
MRLVGIDHVQLAMPPGQEDRARAFYRDLLGLSEVAKPPELAVRGGAWFETSEVRLHLGVEAEFRPARKAHPALLVDGRAELVERLRAAGCAVSESADQVYVDDPFGNRIELVDAARVSTRTGPSTPP